MHVKVDAEQTKIINPSTEEMLVKATLPEHANVEVVLHPDRSIDNGYMMDLSTRIDLSAVNDVAPPKSFPTVVSNGKDREVAALHDAKQKPTPIVVTFSKAIVNAPGHPPLLQK